MNLVKILINTPSGIVLTSKWLKQQGISKDLLKVYRKNGLIKSIARGAFIKAYDIPPIITKNKAHSAIAITFLFIVIFLFFNFI